MTLKDNLSSLAINTFCRVELWQDTLPWPRTWIGRSWSRDRLPVKLLAELTPDMLIMANT